MKTKIILCTLAAALAVGGFTATRSLAADVPVANANRGHLLRQIADKLNLTADQRSQIKTILLGEKDTLAPLLSAEHQARISLRLAIRSGDANETSVRAASAKVAAAEADLAVERMKLYGKIAPILTDAQQQQLTTVEQTVDGFVDNVIARVGSGLDD
jgi:Spy/CpxP family protein refolding chaperone